MARKLGKIVRMARLRSAFGDTYGELRRHLDDQAVGYPATLSGVELRLLEEFFTVPEAEVALLLTYKPESFDSVLAKAAAKGISEESLRERLAAMDRKGSISVKRAPEGVLYSLHPFVVGMLEGRGADFSPRLTLDAAQYLAEAFAFEYLTTDVPQMRVIPVERSIDARQHVATFDQIRARVEVAGERIAVAECMCKKGFDQLARPCKVTSRREVCISFNDYADALTRHGKARHITREEAFEILKQSEKDGLVLMTSTPQEPQFVCACCRCCCGVITMMRMMPRPADFAASNFEAVLRPETCNGCKKCTKRCQVRAIRFDPEAKRVTAVDRGKCIGCGLCVTTCKTGSLELRKRRREFVPPKDTDEMFERIKRSRKTPVAKAITVAKALAGRKL